ncbi:MAG: heavy metal translocating P-type ATPase [Peptoniphilaceae bacterium]|nr:heavy metal translocating P-type ATPase [Peptoniphilaceae bacterium]MDY6019350.1 heavy metal translocating P-type ATPase [Anaerococcus sp.]
MVKNMNVEEKDELKNLVLMGLITFLLTIAEHTWSLNFLIKFIYILLYLVAGKNVLRLAFLGIKNGKPMDENFLMTVATIAAMFIGKYHEAVFVMLFYRFGEFFEDLATNSSRDSIKSLMDIVPDVAIRINKEGLREEVDIDEIEVGDILEITDGGKIPVDGLIISGNASIDTSSLTGESLPLEVAKNDKVLSSSIVIGGIIRIKASKVFDDSIAAKIISLIEESVENKSTSEKFITRFAKIYTPLVVGLALFLALIPPLMGYDLNDYLLRSATFLVLSCPCALVLSVPLSFISTLGLASKNGILIKGSQYLELLDKADVLLTDKTGTLTTGKFIVKNIEYYTDCNKEKILDYIYNMEKTSSHPIAKSIVESLDRKEKHDLFKEVKNVKGLGVYAISKDDKEILLGSSKFVNQKANGDKAVYLSIDSKLYAKISIEDKIKDQAFETIEYLKNYYQNIAIVSGDNKESVKETADKLGLSQYYANLMPDQKIEILNSYKDKGKTTVFVGDGLNDAPVLKQADVGISMGKTASDLAIESSDILITNGEFAQTKKLMQIAHLSVKTVRENVTFIIAVKIIILIIGLFGKATMRMAIFGDVGVSIITILWAMRILNKKI